MKNIFLTIILSLFVGTGFAHELSSDGIGFSVSEGNLKGELVMKVQDLTKQPTLCDYTFDSFKYVESLKALLIDVSREQCGLEAEGIGHGQMTWRLPMALRGYSELKVVLNGVVIGSIVSGPQEKKLVQEQ